MIRKRILNIILVVVLLIFLTPFIGLYINKYLGVAVGQIETFGLSVKDFFSIWIAVFGAIGVSINILLHQQRLLKQQKQIEIQSLSERNSRFSKAIDLLGNSQESVRIGGVHSLIFLAQEYEKEYREVVLDILCSHIRTTTNLKEYKKENDNKPSNEINTIFESLFSKNDSSSFFEGLVANLNGSFLKGLKLYNVSLNGAQLVDVILDNSKLFKTEFIGAQFRNTSLKNSELVDCDFRSATLSNTKFVNTILNRVHFEDSYIDYSNFEESTLYSSHFEGSNLINSHFCRSEIDNGYFEGANINAGTFFICSDLNKTQFQGANLKHILFWGSSFEKTVFDCAHLEHINFEGCDFSETTMLSGGDFELENDELNDFFGDRTILLKKQRKKETQIIKSLYFGLLRTNHKNIIEKRLKEHDFDLQTINKVNSALATNIIESQNSDLKIGISDDFEVDKIIDKIKAIELECGGWRQNRNKK